jgi:hypothetical protein
VSSRRESLEDSPCSSTLRTPWPRRPTSQRPTHAPVCKSPRHAAPHIFVCACSSVRPLKLRPTEPLAPCTAPLHAHARELTPPALATPATPPVALPLAAVGLNSAKGRPLSRLLVGYVDQSLALGQSFQHLLALAAVPFRPGVEHLVSRSKPPGGEGVSHAHRTTCGRGQRRSRQIPCGRPPRVEPHERLHRARPQTAAPGIRCAACVSATQACHLGCSRLIAAWVAATSTQRAGPQTPNR